MVFMMQSPRTGQAMARAGICVDDGDMPHQTQRLLPSGAKSSVKDRGGRQSKSVKKP
jgi:hypothetical protein